MNAHLFSNNGREQIIDIKNIRDSDAEYFVSNDIKVSMEDLNGEFIVYACPYSNESEESEVIVFANGRSCEDVMTELANEAKNAFKD